MSHESRTYRFSNRARSTLAAALSSSATVLRVQDEDSDRFPDLTYEDDIFPLVLWDRALTRFEVVYCTGVNANELTIERAKEGTTAQSFSTGAFVVHTLTSGLLTQIRERASETVGAPTLSGSFDYEEDFELTWTASGTSGEAVVASYSIYRAVEDGSFSLLDTVDGDILEYTDTTLDLYTHGYYRYRVQAVSASGVESDFSNIVASLIDLHWLEVVFLSGFEGDDGDQTFEDESRYDHAISLPPVSSSFNPEIDSTFFKYGETSCAFRSTGGGPTTDEAGLFISDASEFHLADHDFTIELWIRFLDKTPFDRVNVFYSQDGSGAGNRGYRFGWDHVDEFLEFGYSTTGSDFIFLEATETEGMAEGVWHHLACVRDGGDILFFKDGVQIGEAVSIGEDTYIFDSDLDVSLGARSNGRGSISANVDEMRVTIGTARYTSNFTPPTEAFPRG